MVRTRGFKLTWEQRLIKQALKDYAFGNNADADDFVPVRLLYEAYVAAFRSGEWPEFQPLWDVVPDPQRPTMRMLSESEFGVELNYSIPWIEHSRKRLRINGRLTYVRHGKGPGSIKAGSRNGRPTSDDDAE